MLKRVIIGTPDPDLYHTLAQDVQDPAIGAPLAKSTAWARTIVEVRDQLARSTKSDLILIDAMTPVSRDQSGDEAGNAVLEYLVELSHSAPEFPVIALLHFRMENLELHCARIAGHLTLNIKTADAESLRIALVRLGVLRVPEPRDLTLEILVGTHVSNMRLLDENGAEVNQREVMNTNPGRLMMYDRDFRTFQMFEMIESGDDKPPTLRAAVNWRTSLKHVGETLYQDLLSVMMADGLVKALAQSKDGLLRLHIRVHVANELFAVPFEALYDPSNDRFFRVISPIARRLVKDSAILPDNSLLPRGANKLRILFIKAQVDGRCTIVEDTDHRDIATEGLWFSPLSSLDEEEEYFRTRIDGHRWRTGKVEVRFVTGGAGTDLHEEIRQSLAGERFDAIHFAGHSYATPSGQTFLILPSEIPDHLVALPIASFASWSGAAGVRFVYLSSCRGGSWETGRAMVEYGVPHVSGFRWQVEDAMATRFAKAFYDELLLGDRPRPLAKAHRDASTRLYADPNNPIWLSPLLIMQSDDWWRRTA